ncbi:MULTISPECIES: GNAT family N-acetyltransferase [Photorhabdus]|uniref:GNAT family N-acetyltransferase n=2 Tax=Photorhabdus TaxID=29487 RepID=A0A2S8QFJ2_9GAMM|nr:MULTISPECIES: GNAT family N-acetyltransferase [Photorhabdus]OCA53255.1 putative N-acetyltransferase YjaB [Photorhabdus namnaonensis]PQQ26806.1 GNAT family N-acetyltransferase [Photorhabdus hindustanensis]PQQ34033.1 GNAT family N-acetyltransferase [Photorhabdus luminescens]
MTSQSIKNVVLTELNGDAEEIRRVVDIWYLASIKCHHFVSESFWHSCKEDMMNIYIPGAETVVAKYNDEIVGFISLVDNILASIFVHPDFQGKGIGKKLLFDAFGKRSDLVLNVYSKNKLARDFYKMNGFVEEKEGVDEHTGELEITMKWNG